MSSGFILFIHSDDPLKGQMIKWNVIKSSKLEVSKKYSINLATYIKWYFNSNKLSYKSTFLANTVVKNSTSKTQ